MAKVWINGEAFDWETSRRPMSEALAIEAALKCRYADFEADLASGSARALCGFIWLVWRRNGRDVPIGDILSGDVEIERNDFRIEDDAAPEDDALVPTDPPPADTPTTPSDT